jgi:hypothetical protein
MANNHRHGFKVWTAQCEGALGCPVIGKRRIDGSVVCDEHWEGEQESSSKLRLSKDAMKVLYENQN